MTDERLTGQQIADAGLTGWTLLPVGLTTRVATDDFAAGLALVDAIGAEAEKANHHPDLRLSYGFVEVRLKRHDVGGVTERDVALARTVSDLAERAGHRTDGSVVAVVEMGLDSPDYQEIAPFWAAVTATEQPERDGVKQPEVVDPSGALPDVWFQQSGSEEPRQHWHPDVWIDPAEVPSRIDAAIAAGGTLVSDEEAPSFWVLADPQGNKVCLCTWQDRER